METHTILRKCSVLLSLVVLLTLGWAAPALAQDQTAAAKVWTDKDDYAPGEIAYFSGENWWPNEDVSIYIESIHAQGSYFIAAQADAWGSFANYEFLILEKHLGEEFLVLAIGEESGYMAEWSFTDANVRFTTSGLPGGLNVTVTYSGSSSGSVTFSTSGSGQSSAIALVGNLTFSFSPESFTAGGNTYVLTGTTPSSPVNVPSQGSFNITGNYTLQEGAEGAIESVSIGSQSSTVVYGASAAVDYNVTAQRAENGTVNGTYSVTGLPSGVTAAFAPATFTATGGNAFPESTLTLNVPDNIDAGSYPFTVTLSAGSAGSASTEGTLVVSQRAITITADAKTKVYGEADEDLTFQITDGSLAFEDAFEGALVREVGEDVGAYEIQQGSVVLNDNYTLTYVPADYTITERAITITADAKTKVYGEDDEALTFQITDGSLAFEDEFEGSLVRVVGENVGTYQINQGSVALNSNYDLSYVPANYTITLRAVEITADAKTKVYGEADEDLTFQITDGSLAFEDAFEGSLVREVGEDVGAYEIQQGSVVLNDNYTLTYVPADYTITLRAVEITADAKTKVYGEDDEALTFQITAGSLAFEDAFEGSLVREVGEDVGAYEIQQGSVVLNDNYTLTYVPADYTITERAITITADAKTKVYGEDDEALTFQITAGSLAFDDEFEGALVREVGEDVGAYEIQQGSVVLNDNYTLTYVPADYTITERAITITADAKTKVYGEDDEALTFQITAGSLAFDDEFEGALVREVGEDVGAYEIQQGSVVLNDNYTLTYVPADYTITLRAVEITADAKTKVYGEADEDLTFQITAGSLAFEDAFEGSLVREVGEDVGAYEIQQGSVVLNDNYTLTYVPADYTITLRAVEITADAKTKVYGEADEDLTFQITDGSLAFEDAFEGSLVREVGEDVGAYEIQQGSVVLNDNYTLTYVPADYTITLRAVEITADAKTKVYGEADEDLTFQITDGSLAFEDEFEGSLVREVGEDVGAYEIQQGSVVLNDNYTLTYVPADYTITERAITITADAKTKVYGEDDEALTFQITDGSLAFEDEFEGSLVRVVGENVGTYQINQGSVALNSNYDLSYVPANYTITLRAVEITADAKTKVYGEADEDLTFQITDGSLAFEDAFEGSLVREVGEDVGAYEIQQGSVVLNDNYTLTYVPADYTITLRAVEITADAKTKVYGEDDEALTFQITAGSLAFEDAFEGSLVREVGEDVGAYEIQQGSVVLNDNYTLTYVPADYTITERAITITADAKTKVYGEDDEALTFQITAGSLAFDDEFEGALVREVGEDVGAYEIQQGSVVLNDNYTLTYVPADYTITERAITITADAKTKVYGEDDEALTFQITAGSLAFDDEFEGALVREVGEDVGAYEIQQGSVVLNDNYTLTYVPADYTITLRAVEITADAKTKVYGEADEDLTFQITDGSLAFEDAFEGALVREVGEDVGAYEIQQGSVVLNDNYTLTYVPADYTITLRAVEITADAKTKVYGEADEDLTFQITDGSLAFEDAFEGSLVRVVGENVGTYQINQGSVALNSNYDLSYVPANYTITLRAVEITADAKTKVYGEADEDLTFQITDGSLAFEDEFEGSLVREVGEDVGAYEIQQGSVVLNDNYTLTYVPADYTITLRAVEITADAKTKVYGEADEALTFQITAGSLAFDDEFEGALVREVGEDVGAYEIQQGSVVLNDNYTLTYVPADYTITERAITITADAKTKVYGEADEDLTFQITDGSLAFEDEFEGSLVREVGEDVGAYEIQQGSVVLNDNYTLTYVPADYTITLRAVEITADAKTKVYGEADEALTFQITAGSLAFDDEFEGALVREVGEDVGAYEIQQGSVVLNDNYTLTYVPADYTITLRAVEITADAKTKVYGEADEDLTFQITDGSLAFEDAFEGALVREVGEDVGAYEIQQGSVVLNDNYTLTYVPADYTITLRAVEITADAKTKVYGEADEDLTFQITDGSLAFEDAFEGSLVRVVGENVGTYQINQGSVALNSNYDLSYVPANYTITLRAVEITADAKTKVYGEADEDLTFQITDGSLAFEDEFEGSLVREVGEDVGAYEIQQGSVVLNDNYTLTYVPADYTITERAITITADAKTKVYGEDDEALTFQITDGSLAFEDEFEGSLVRVVGENVGTYQINQGSVALNSNYDLSYVPANYTITLRAVEITADAKTKVYGEADEDLTFQITDGSLAFEDEFEGALVREVGEDVGTYQINQGSVVLNDNYTLTYVPANYTITPASATVAYTGTRIMATTGETDFVLSARITSGVDLLGEKVRFTIMWGTNNVEIREVGISETLNETGTDAIVTAVYNFILPASEGSRQLTIDTEVINNFAGSDKGVIAVVYIPLGDHITGGGFIVPDNGESKGLHSSADGSHANFGFNFKYQRQGKNTVLQGEANLVIRSTDGQTLQFKSTEAVAMGINNSGDFPTAQFTVKGELRRGNEILFSDLTMHATMTDRGNGGGRNAEKDDIGFTIWNGNQLIYSSHWNGWHTPRTELSGGNIVIHRGGTDAGDVELLDAVADIALEREQLEDKAARLAFSAYPNPFRDRLSLQFTADSNTRAILELYDMNGALMEILWDGQVYQGEKYEFEYRPDTRNTAVIFYRLIIGGDVVTGKLIRRQ